MDSSNGRILAADEIESYLVEQAYIEKVKTSQIRERMFPFNKKDATKEEIINGRVDIYSNTRLSKMAKAYRKRIKKLKQKSKKRNR